MSLPLNVSGFNQGIAVQERRISLTATKDALTASGVDEADKNDKSSGSLAHDEATWTSLRRLTDSDVIRLLLEEKKKTCPSYLVVGAAMVDGAAISKMRNFELLVKSYFCSYLQIYCMS